MSEEIAARYAEYSTAELFELARAGESRFRPEAWQALKNELRKRGLELTPEDEALASGQPGDDVASDSEPPVSEPALIADIGEWLGLFVVVVVVGIVITTYRTLAAFAALSWIGVFYALHAVVLVIGLVLMYHRDPVAPRFWRDLLILVAALYAFLGAGHLMAWSVAAPSVAMSIGWAAYWANSPRVRAIFATRQSATSPDAEMEESDAQVASDAERVPSVDELHAELDDARRQGNFAVLYIVTWLALTISTYFTAPSRGRSYYIAWGGILLGIFGAARSNVRRNRARALLQKAPDVVMPDAPGESQNR